MDTTTSAIQEGQSRLQEVRQELHNQKAKADPIGEQLRSLLVQLDTGERIEQLIMEKIATIHAKGLPDAETQDRIDQLIAYCTTTLETEHPHFRNVADETPPLAGRHRRRRR